MKLTNFNKKQYLDVCVGSVTQVYEAYYRGVTWTLRKRMLSIILALVRIVKIWVAIIQSNSLEQLNLYDKNNLFFIHTGNYVSDSFITFLKTRNDMLLDKFSVRYLSNLTDVDIFRPGSKLKIKIFGLSLLILYHLLKNICKKQNRYLIYHLIIKHFEHDILPELFRKNDIRSELQPLLIAVTDEANPRFQAWYRLNTPLFHSTSKLIHIQHGIISSESQEWQRSIADIFFVMSSKTNTNLQKIFLTKKQVFIIGPYLRQPENTVSITKNLKQDEILVLLQPYVAQFGSEDNYLSLYRQLGILAAQNQARQWRLRFHPVQTHSSQIMQFFNSTNCIIDNKEELSIQIKGALAVLGICSQTSYEVITCKKPLFLIRTNSMSISTEFDKEFSNHIIDIAELGCALNNFQYETEIEKSKNTLNSPNLSIAPFSHDEVRQKICQALMEIKDEQ